MSKCAVNQENLSIARSLLLDVLANIDFKGNEREIRQIKAELGMVLFSFLDYDNYEYSVNILKNSANMNIDLENDVSNNEMNDISSENLDLARLSFLSSLSTVSFLGTDKDIAIEKAELSMNLCSLLDPKKYACNIKLLNYGEQKRKGRNR